MYFENCLDMMLIMVELFSGPPAEKGEKGDKGKRGLVGFHGYKGDSGCVIYGPSPFV
jgi:hypothetical protein